MAQPVNSFDTYDTIGIREDLQDVIYDVSPEQTPFLSSLPRVKAANTFHEWQTDALRSAGTNAHIEGDDDLATAITPTVRVGNYTQIFKETAVVTGSQEKANKAGRSSDMAREMVRRGKVMKFDMETALFANVARDAGSGSTPRYLGGLGAWVTTNEAVGSGGSGSAGTGTDTRTDGTQRALSQTIMDGLMEDIWTAADEADTYDCYLSAFQMNKAVTFTGVNNQRSTVSASRSGENVVVNDITVYVSPFGSVKFIKSRYCRSRDVYILDPKGFALGVYRPMTSYPLAKTGDNEKRSILTEVTLISKNEKSSGIVADCTAS